MARAVLQRMTAEELWLLTGRADGDGTDGARAPPLDEDGAADPGGELESLAGNSDDEVTPTGAQSVPEPPTVAPL